jgi:hypothetical protein
MRNYVDLIVLEACTYYLVIRSFLLIGSNIYLASYWSAGLGTYLQALALASYWLDDFTDVTPTAGKTY